ncbi:hypothetical protein CKM354_000608800 [Cercospora kikuchii]|uniref:Uncharacterized protein n=1 Tax=Cercospora kikuchii TaxID=84275 RepID=A0A9P3CNC3_9PEZI|nr:uncharacterized protein CKM354_000608800 [Cercospora kikuchii]GIZ42835.1 hypothetical protein CKM354_000608800 [Cercospora kikuchii]
MDKERGVSSCETGKQTAPTMGAEYDCIREEWTEERVKTTRKNAREIRDTKGLYLVYALLSAFVLLGYLSFKTCCIVKPPLLYLARYIIDRYTHTGLESRIPLINRTWTIVPKIWPDDSALSKDVAGTDSWPCQRDIIVAWLRRLRNGQRPYSPGEEATWVCGMLTMVMFAIFLALLDQWLDGHIDFGSIGKWMSGGK